MSLPNDHSSLNSAEQLSLQGENSPLFCRHSENAFFQIVASCCRLEAPLTSFILNGCYIKLQLGSAINKVARNKILPSQ